MLHREFVYWRGWFEDECPPTGNDRYYTFKIALNLLLQRGGGIIVETGTVNEGDVGAGASTIIFGKFLKRYGGKLYTIDNSAAAIEESKKKTAPYSTNIEYILGDSLECLSKFDKEIGLLYLDSYDYPVHEGDGTIEDCQLHQLKEIQLAYPKVSPGGIILLDDNMLPEGGKAKKAKEFLEGQGATCIFDFQSSLWIKPN